VRDFGRKGWREETLWGPGRGGKDSIGMERGEIGWGGCGLGASGLG